ncbi:26S protease regulatory subunit 4 [Dirofilaria immitis]|nr:26S protease regulatory subunit 4 [Dirofilaria immitis]
MNDVQDDDLYGNLFRKSRTFVILSRTLETTGRKQEEERSKVNDLRGTPIAEQLESGCAVLLNHKTHAVIGILADDTDSMVSVMKLEKAPQETYADIGGLDQQIQEIKESVELSLTHPEYYEEMGIKPPKDLLVLSEHRMQMMMDDFKKVKANMLYRKNERAPKASKALYL